MSFLFGEDKRDHLRKALTLNACNALLQLVGDMRLVLICCGEKYYFRVGGS
jgi:hypothetical protein